MFNTENYQLAYNNFTMNKASNEEAPAKPTVYNCEAGCSNGPRVRTAFTDSQLMELEREFGRCIYLHQARRIDISKRLGLNEKVVKVWFQNRRMKFKKTATADENRIDYRKLKGYKSRAETTTAASRSPLQTNIMTGIGHINHLPVIQPKTATILTNSIQVQSPLQPNRLKNEAMRQFNPQVMVKMPTDIRLPIAYNSIDVESNSSKPKIIKVEIMYPPSTNFAQQNQQNYTQESIDQRQRQQNPTNPPVQTSQPYLKSPIIQQHQAYQNPQYQRQDIPADQHHQRQENFTSAIVCEGEDSYSLEEILEDNEDSFNMEEFIQFNKKDPIPVEGTQESKPSDNTSGDPATLHVYEWLDQILCHKNDDALTQERVAAIAENLRLEIEAELDESIRNPIVSFSFPELIDPPSNK